MSRVTRLVTLSTRFARFAVIARGLAPIALPSRRPPSLFSGTISYLDFQRPSLTLSSSDVVTVTKTANRPRKERRKSFWRQPVTEDVTSKASRGASRTRRS